MFAMPLNSRTLSRSNSGFSNSLRAGLLTAVHPFEITSQRLQEDNILHYELGPQFQHDLQDAVYRFWSSQTPGIRLEFATVRLKIWMRFWARVTCALLNICYIYRMFLEYVIADRPTYAAWLHYAAICTLGAEAVKVTWYVLKAIVGLLKATYEQPSEWSQSVLVIVTAETLVRVEAFSLMRYLPLRRRAFDFVMLEEVLAHHVQSATEKRRCGAFWSCWKAMQNIGTLVFTVLSPVAVLVKFECVSRLATPQNATWVEWFKLVGVINQIAKTNSKARSTQAVLEFLATVNADDADAYDPKVHFIRLLGELIRSMVTKLGIVKAIAMWCYTDASLLGQVVRDGGSEVQRAFMKVDDIVRELEGLKRCPFVKPVPECFALRLDVLQTVLECCWTYSLNGVEGHRAGHIIAVGCWEELQECGTVRGRNCWQGEPLGFINKDSSGADLQDLLIEMNQDGVHIIDGDSSRICANKFFVNRIAQSPTGGAGAAAAKELSTVSGTVVFKISSDGSIKEFREGELFAVHCGHRILGSGPPSFKSSRSISEVP